MGKRILWLAILAAMLSACGPKTEKEVVMVVETTMGTVEFKL